MKPNVSSPLSTRLRLARHAAEPGEFYLGDSGFIAFEFQRAASRLIEMRSSGHLALPHGHLALAASTNAGGPGET